MSEKLAPQGSESRSKMHHVRDGETSENSAKQWRQGWLKQNERRAVKVAECDLICE